MAADLDRDQLLYEVRQVGRGHARPDLALLIATMMAATRLCPVAEDATPGFLDQSFELTQNEWHRMLEALAQKWTANQTVALENPFEQALRLTPHAPGELERLRRLVLVAQWDSAQRQHLCPLWLLQAVLDMARSQGGSIGMDPVVTELISNIVAPTKKMRVYCAYDGAIDVAFAVAAKGATVAVDVEASDLATLSACLARAANLPLQIRRGDPIVSFVQDRKTGAEATCDVSFVSAPFNARPSDLMDRAYELDSRSPPPPSSDAAGLSLAIARGRKMAICLAAPSLLFQTSKAHQAFKSYVLREYGFDTIVSLPSGTSPGTAISPALLIVRPAADSEAGGPGHDVFMVDARGGRSKSKSGASLPPGLDALVHDREVSDISNHISSREIAANDFVLLPERYVLSAEARLLRDRASSSDFVLLEEAVEFLRPQALKNPKDEALLSEQLVEVGVADIDEVGLIRAPHKEMKAAPDTAWQALKSRLESGDVLFVVKGSVGKIGFVRDVPEGTPWVAGQSFVIFRLRRHGPISDPRVIFRYLTSSIGQGMIESLRVGATVPSLQMADVRRIQIEVPSPEDQAAISRDVDKLFEMQEEIERLRMKLAEDKRRIWPENTVERC